VFAMASLDLRYIGRVQPAVNRASVATAQPGRDRGDGLSMSPSPVIGMSTIIHDDTHRTSPTTLLIHYHSPPFRRSPMGR
jgi:hypothetical protein